MNKFAIENGGVYDDRLFEHWFGHQLWRVCPVCGGTLGAIECARKAAGQMRQPTIGEIAREIALEYVDQWRRDQAAEAIRRAIVAANNDEVERRRAAETRTAMLEQHIVRSVSACLQAQEVIEATVQAIRQSAKESFLLAGHLRAMESWLALHKINPRDFRSGKDACSK